MALPTNKNNIPFKSVVDQVLQRDGVDTQLVGLATDLVAYINDRLKQAWHHEFWPQTVRVEKRHYHQVFCAGQEYEIGDILFSNGSYYVCVRDTQTDPSFTTVNFVNQNPEWIDDPNYIFPTTPKNHDTAHIFDEEDRPRVIAKATTANLVQGQYYRIDQVRTVETITEFTAEMVGRRIRAAIDQPSRNLVQGETYTLTAFVNANQMTHSGGANIIIGQQKTESNAAGSWELLSNDNDVRFVTDDGSEILGFLPEVRGTDWEVVKLESVAIQETVLNPNWSLIEDYPKLVPYWQNGDDILADGKEYMHRIYSVSMRNPNRTANPGYLNFELLHDGVIVSDLAPAEIFIKYQIEPQVYTLEPLQENRVYIPDIPFGDLARKSDIVYDNVTGHCYKPLQNATEQDPFTDREFWERVPFPSFLERYVVHGAYADWLASEGQLDKSKNEDAYASKILEDLMDMYAPQDQVNTQVKFSRLG